MCVARSSPLRQREDVGSWWSDHLQSQRESGQIRAAYSRDRGLDSKYFTFWKRKLRDARAAATHICLLRLVPIKVRAERSSRAPAISDPGGPSPPGTAMVIHLNLGNGMSLSLELAAGVLPALVRELVAVRC